MRILLAAVLVCALPAFAQETHEKPIADYRPLAAEHTTVLRDFRFHSGQTMPELRQHYVTWGTPRRNSAGQITNAVLLLHGTLGTGVGWGRPFGDAAHPLLGPGAPLDAQRYFIIAPDTIGSGRSSKPSDGLRMDFPAFNLQDIVEAQRHILDHLNVGTLVAVMGGSMGGRQAWQWAVQYPDRMQAIVPMISSPFANIGRRGLIDYLTEVLIRRDPGFQNGRYQENPEAVRYASLFYGIFLVGLGGWDERLPTRDDVRKLAEAGGGPFAQADATDLIYMMRLNDGFDAWSQMDRVRAPVLIINVKGDEIVPVQLGHAQKTVARLKDAQYIEVVDPVFGHGGLMRAVHDWAPKLRQWLEEKTRLE